MGAITLVLALTILVTWPQATQMSSMTSPHFDAQFSIWRLGWIAHALATAPTHIFDANIFYPAPRTLAYRTRRCFRACSERRSSGWG